MEKVVVEAVLPKKLYENLKRLVDEGKYATVSEAIRAAIRNLVLS